MKKLAIGIDIGGQSAKLGVVDRDGNVIETAVVTSMQPTVQEFVSDLARAVNNLREKTAHLGEMEGIGADAPNANCLNGSIEYAPNLTWGRDSDGQPTIIPLAELISRATGLRVTLTNDANAAALGEHTYGTAIGIDNFIMLTLGTGVGSGIIIDGKLVYGHDGFAGELGHVCAVPGGRPCNCGLYGCLETYASATGVARSARQALHESDRPSILRDIDEDRISSKDVYEAAKNGDATAIDVFRFTGKLLGKAMADFVKFSAPEAIVLFGGLTHARQFFHDDMVEAMNANLLKIWKNRIKILYSSLPESNAAILGASSLVW